MAETRAIQDLYDIMNDGTAGIPNRLRAAVSASRVEPLAVGNESEPPAVVFLRSIVASEHAGLLFRPDYRREAASALAYWERRAKKAELQYDVADQAERREGWRKLVNGAIRVHLSTANRWPADKHILLSASDTFETPAGIDPEVAMAALLGGNRQQRRRQRAIDERLPAGTWSGTEEERRTIIRAIAEATAKRLAEFDLGEKPHNEMGPSMGQV